MISIGIVIMITGSFEKSIKLFLKSANPALLNAETEVNRLKNRPLPMPNFGINDKHRLSVPNNSVAMLYMARCLISLITPPGSSIFQVIINKILLLIDIFLFKKMRVSIATVTIPNPPICISNKIMISPKILNCVPTSTGDRPVTVNALEATNNASIKLMGFFPV